MIGVVPTTERRDCRAGLVDRASAALRSVRYTALLAPVGVVALGRAAVRPDKVPRLWHLVAGREAGDSPRPGRAWLLGHAVASILLGLVGWVVLAMTAIALVRGPFYGLVDPGPYDNAWGGPTRAGAWSTHFLVSVPLVAAGVALAAGVAALHRRVGGRLEGRPAPWWVAALTLAACALTLLLVIGWVGQLGAGDGTAQP